MRGFGSTLDSMNDPHVVALVYRVRHHESVDYGDARPLDFENDRFVVRVKCGKARFELKEHWTTEQKARELVEPFIDDWEFNAGLQRDPDCFLLDFEKAEIIDRKPTPGVTEVNAEPARWHFSTSSPKVTVSPPTYPSPSTGIDSSHPDVQTLYERYRKFREGGEDLPSFAYFCLTVLEYPFTYSKRKRAAASYDVDYAVLDRIGTLSSKKGGSGARKREGVDTPLTDDEGRFLERATVRLIRRLAEYHAAKGSLPTISMKDVS